MWVQRTVVAILVAVAVVLSVWAITQQAKSEERIKKLLEEPTCNIPRGCVNTNQIADGAVTEAKLAPGVIPDLLFAGLEEVWVSEVIPPGAQTSVRAVCPQGSVPVAGGWETPKLPREGIVVLLSKPKDNGWVVRFDHKDQGSQNVKVCAICAKVETAP